MDASLNKNTPKINSYTCFEDGDFQLSILLDLNQQADKVLRLQTARVHMLFSLGGPVTFAFGPHYKRTLPMHHAFIIYQPEYELQAQLEAGSSVQMIHLSIRLNKLHELFNPDVHSAPIFKPEQASHKFYEELDLSPDLLMVLNQMELKHRIDPNNRLFFQAKTLEALSLLFAEKKSNTEQCPFLKNEITLQKIKVAKNMLLQQFKDPPTIPELARLVQLNEFQLKAGFKEIYGQGPYHYLMTYKLEMARKLLSEQQLQVQQVAHEIGYTNISHFIDAFKKQFGITPKKLLMGYTQSNRGTDKSVKN